MIRRLLVTAAFAVVLVAAVATPAVAVSPAASDGPNVTAPVAPPACSVVAHHQDAQHTGLTCSLPSRALRSRWSVDLGAEVSYPLVVGNFVYVLTATPGGTYGTQLRALDLRTGVLRWGPVPLGGTYYWGSLAFDDQRVFTTTFDGLVSAFTATTGRQLWAAQTSNSAGELVASNGVVYLQGGGPVTALDGRTGRIRWTVGWDGTGSSVAVDATGVYVAGGCTVGKLALATGSTIWRSNSGCTGGGGGQVFLNSGRVFESLDQQVRQADTGKLVGSYSGTPAFSGGDVYLVSGTTVYVQDAVTRRPIRTFTLPAAAVTSPLVTADSLFVGTADKRVVRVALADGAVDWTSAVPGVPGGGAEYSAPVADIAVGSGRLLVPAGRTLTAFG